MAIWLFTEDLKDQLAITVTTWDAAISGILLGVQSVIENLISSPVVQDTTVRTEYYNGEVSRKLKLRFRPTSTAGMRVWCDNQGNFGDNPDGSFGTDTELVLGRDFDLEDVRNGYSQSAILVNLNGIWPTWWRRDPDRLASTLAGEFGAVKVSYKAGWAFTDIPQAIIQAGYAEGVSLYRMLVGKRAGGMLLNSESWNGYSYSQAFPNMLKMDGYGAPRLTSPIAMTMLGGLGLIDPAIA